MERGLGLSAQVPEETIRLAGIATEHAGYSSFWINHPPNLRALPKLGPVADATSRIHLGVGVIPLSHHSIEDIVGEVDESGIPLDRFYLGLGSGSGPDPVRRTRLALEAIRAQVGTSLVVAAMGPRMCRLAGEMADGVLFNWLTPEWADQSVQWVRQGAERAGRPTPRTFAYVRVALGNDAIARLRKEAESYSAIPHYARHFARMAVPALGTAVTSTTPAGIATGLARWDGVIDSLVVRAIVPHDTPEALQTLISAAAPH